MAPAASKDAKNPGVASESAVVMKMCGTCKQLKDTKIMYINIKAGSLGSKEDVWKCRACNALISRINRLTDLELISGYNKMEQSTKEDFMSKAVDMFKQDLAKELQEALDTPHS